jgi:hypothetical protein
MKAYKPENTEFPLSIFIMQVQIIIPSHFEPFGVILLAKHLYLQCKQEHPRA